MRQHGHLRRMSRLGKLLTHRAVLARKPAQMIQVQALVRLAQPLLKQWAWARFIEGIWRTDYGKNTPFARR